MKHTLSTLGAALMVSLAVTPVPVLAHADHGKPQYGGVVAEAGHAQFELVGQGGKLVLYVTNHGDPVATAGASGKLIVLEGSAKREIALQPAGDNRLEASGTLSAGAKVLVSIQFGGKKPMQARLVMP